MTFNLSVTALGGGIFDIAGKTGAFSKRFMDKVTDYTPVWKASEAAMQKNVIDVWAMGQGSWMKLNKDYLFWKKWNGYSTDKNVKTGRMKDAMTYGQVNIMTGMAWSYGIDRTSGEWYEGKAVVPYPEMANKKRPFVVMTKKLIDSVQNNMKDYLSKLFKGKR